MSISASVYKLDINNKLETKPIYKGIETIEEAYLLAQLEMDKKEFGELICILPGYNKNLESDNPEEYNKALELAEKYKV